MQSPLEPDEHLNKVFTATLQQEELKSAEKPLHR